MKLYSIQVKDGGVFQDVNLPDAGNLFYTRKAAAEAVRKHRAYYPFKLQMRIVKL